MSGSLAAIGTFLVSKIGVELKDTFLDLSDHFLFEGLPLHPLARACWRWQELAGEAAAMAGLLKELLRW